MTRPWLIHVPASPRVNEPYAHPRHACDSRNYRRVSQNYCPPAYGGFTLEIYVRYNNKF